MRRITIVAAVLMGVAASVGGVATASATVQPAKFAARDEGFGATLAIAEQNAKTAIQGDYGPCTGVTVYADGQNANGTWYAWVSGECSAYH